MTYLRGVCDRLADSIRMEAASFMTALAVIAPTRAALPSLRFFTDDEDIVADADPEGSKAAMTKAHLDECLHAEAASTTKDPFGFLGGEQDL